MFNIGLKSAGGGHYKHKPGGHLILFSLKLVVEFPPGSNAVICHCNPWQRSNSTWRNTHPIFLWSAIPLGAVWVPNPEGLGEGQLKTEGQVRQEGPVKRLLQGDFQGLTSCIKIR